MREHQIVVYVVDVVTTTILTSIISSFLMIGVFLILLVYADLLIPGWHVCSHWLALSTLLSSDSIRVDFHV